MAAVRALVASRLRAASAFAPLHASTPRAALHGSAPRPGARVALVLSGCGVYDGTELHEASAVLVHLSRGGAEVQIFAPDIPQMHVVDHTKGQPSESETRNVLTESARIARGKITDLARLSAANHDAAIFPGGFGAAKNLSCFSSRFSTRLRASRKCSVLAAPSRLVPSEAAPLRLAWEDRKQLRRLLWGQTGTLVGVTAWTWRVSVETPQTGLHGEHLPGSQTSWLLWPTARRP
ncbi:ES1 protein homolog, mitochondrial isoform X2 [Enhydra lutris kenyoni]|uniref:ES1 protein homolog, mitochondrial isoform X2 n=1 Tax=Enhydra lutris kenyoni TaxID=391180 RepID=A0A2Y9KEV6_ENHLU|nr:ES1 protein homolog, mitochondrial isoform X2 [Enhydra lutris kenyoni]